MRFCPLLPFATKENAGDVDRRGLVESRCPLIRVGRQGDLRIRVPVLLETEWVLRSRYALSKSEILGAFSGLLDAAELLFEDEASLEQALYTWKDSSPQFADCLIGARNWALECRATASFDAKALRLPGFIEA